MADIIQIRRDTAANWTSADPTLANGEAGYETDTGKLKIGDGSTAWTSLGYFASASAINDLSDVTITSLTDGEVLLSSSGTFINRTLAEAGISAVGHTHTESDITDLGAYLTDITGEPIGDLSDVTTSSLTNGDVLIYNSGLGVFVNAQLTESNISDFGTYLEDITGESIGSLSDVTLTGLGDNEVLLSSSGTFINQTLTEAGIAAAADVLLKDGTVGLTAAWDAGSYQIRAETFQSDVATGTAPLTIASTTKVDNLNCERVGGVKHFGVLTSANEPGSGMVDGDLYHNSDLNEPMFYDGTRSKWLSVSTVTINTAYNGTCSTGNYLRSINGTTLGNTKGPGVPKGTLVAVHYNQTSSSASTLNFLNNGSSAGSFSIAASAGAQDDETLNIDLAKGNLSPANDAGGADIASPNCVCIVRRRA